MYKHISVEKVIQPIGEFYLAKMDSDEIHRMSQADIMKIEIQSNRPISTGIQRNINTAKIRKLKKYINSIKASFPNSIILNIEEDKIVKISEKEIIVKESNETFKIIDGQHRVKSFEDGFKDKFELIVSIFVGLSEEEQKDLFTTINSEQTNVNPSMKLYSYSGSSDYTPRKVVVELAELFVSDINSPWYKKIKLLGTNDEFTQDGAISLIAFANPILNYIYDDDDFYEIRDDIRKDGTEILSDYDQRYFPKFILWYFYRSNQTEALYKILFNYFSSFKSVYKREWGNSRSILTKTTGYNAIMYLFKDLFEIGIDQHNLSYEFFYSKIGLTKKMVGMMDTRNFGASGRQASIELYNYMASLIFGKTNKQLEMNMHEF